MLKELEKISQTLKTLENEIKEFELNKGELTNKMQQNSVPEIDPFELPQNREMVCISKKRYEELLNIEFMYNELD